MEYVEARETSSLCPICGERLSPNVYGVGAQNLLRRYLMDVGAPSVHPEGPPMTTERDEE
jgi:transposase